MVPETGVEKFKNRPIPGSVTSSVQMRNDRKLAEFGSKPVLLTVMGAGLFFVQFKSSRFSSSTVRYGG